MEQHFEAYRNRNLGQGGQELEWWMVNDYDRILPSAEWDNKNWIEDHETYIYFVASGGRQDCSRRETTMGSSSEFR